MRARRDPFLRSTQWVASFRLFAEPAAGCLIPAARQVIERVGVEAKLGLVICGGNVAFSDVEGWVKRFGVSAG